MNKCTKDKDPFTGADCTSVETKCPVCNKWVEDLYKHIKTQPDPAHAVAYIHLS